MNELVIKWHWNKIYCPLNPGMTSLKNKPPNVLMAAINQQMKINNHVISTVAGFCLSKVPAIFPVRGWALEK